MKSYTMLNYTKFCLKTQVLIEEKKPKNSNGSGIKACFLVYDLVFSCF